MERTACDSFFDLPTFEESIFLGTSIVVPNPSVSAG
jgi:hypothetical protein